MISTLGATQKSVQKKHLEGLGMLSNIEPLTLLEQGAAMNKVSTLGVGRMVKRCEKRQAGQLSGCWSNLRLGQ